VELTAGVWDIDWRRLARRSVIAALVVVGTVELVRYAAGGGYGFDFRGGAWAAGSDVLHGRNPYPPPYAEFLRPPQHAFFTTPLLAVLAVPFSVLPFAAAITLWNLLCVAGLILALRILGVRDVRMYALALFSIPLIDSLESGQPDALFALLAAVTWRYRDSDRGAVAAGLLIAAKVVAWPLLVWLLLTRRFRSFWVATGSLIVSLAVSWASIGFKGLEQYPKLLAADARAAEGWRFVYSVTHGLLALGVSRALSVSLTFAVACVVGVLIVLAARRRDVGLFTAALTVGLLASPIVWLHYLVLAFIPLAIARSRDVRAWAFASGAGWILLIVVPPGGLRAWAVCAMAAAIAICAISGGESGLNERRMLRPPWSLAKEAP
jgi:alpha-1,2-mannosyltransferase